MTAAPLKKRSMPLTGPGSRWMRRTRLGARGARVGSSTSAGLRVSNGS